MTAKKLINNSIIGIVQLILISLITLVSVPIFINKLGIESYGVFAVVSVLGNLNILANFGLNSALIVYISKQGKCNDSNLDIIVTQILILISLSIFIAIVLFLKEFILLNVLAIPGKFIVDAENLFIWMIFANSILMIGQSYTAVIDAQQKIYLTNISQFLYSLVYWGGQIIVVSNGGSLEMVGIVAFVAAVIWLTLVYFIFRFVWGKLHYHGLRIKFIYVAKKQLIYGTKIYISGFLGFLFEPLSKILLSNFIGLNSVALFEIGIKIKGQINGFLAKALYPFLPYIANSVDNRYLKRKIFDFSKKIQLIVIPISIIVLFVLNILTKLWLGNEYSNDAANFIIALTISMLLFSIPILPIYQYLAAQNKADKNIWIQFSSTFVNIVIFFTFYKYFSLYTILISNTLALIISFLLGNLFQYKYLGANFYEERIFYAKILGFGFVCTIFCLIIRYFIPVSIWDLLIYPVFVFAFFIYFIRQFKLLTYNDIETYFGVFPFLKVTLSRMLIIP